MPSTAARYLELCKPKVVALIVFTAVVGMFLAVPAWPPLNALVAGGLQGLEVQGEMVARSPRLLGSAAGPA